jgi:hypothetical protein
MIAVVTAIGEMLVVRDWPFSLSPSHAGHVQMLPVLASGGSDSKLSRVKALKKRCDV